MSQDNAVERWGHEAWQQELMELVTGSIPASFTGELVINVSAGIAVDMTVGKIRVRKEA